MTGTNTFWKERSHKWFYLTLAWATCVSLLNGNQERHHWFSRSTPACFILVLCMHLTLKRLWTFFIMTMERNWVEWHEFLPWCISFKYSVFADIWARGSEDLQDTLTHLLCQHWVFQEQAGWGCKYHNGCTKALSSVFITVAFNVFIENVYFLVSKGLDAELSLARQHWKTCQRCRIRVENAISSNQINF